MSAGVVIGREASRSKWFVGIVVAVALLGTPADSSAHHSFAMFDFSRVVVLQATIKEFQWTNPHVILTFLADATDGGPPETWWAELTSPGNLTRVGWSKRAFKAGDRVEVTLHPLRDGSHGGAFTKAVIAGTGQTWTSDLRSQEKPELGIEDGGTPAPGGDTGAPAWRRFGCSVSGVPFDGAFVGFAFALGFVGAVVARRRARGARCP